MQQLWPGISDDADRNCLFAMDLPARVKYCIVYFEFYPDAVDTVCPMERTKAELLLVVVVESVAFPELVVDFLSRCSSNVAVHFELIAAFVAVED